MIYLDSFAYSIFVAGILVGAAICVLVSAAADLIWVTRYLAARRRNRRRAAPQ